MKLFKAPSLIKLNGFKSIFLAGSIDMGNSIDWQKETQNYFKGLNLNIYNPRRDSWDNSWEQTYSNAQFYQQVNWELDALTKADIIIMNFLSDSKSPITLLELGLFATSKKIYVCCPKDFYRRGNVEIVCNNYCIPLFETFNELLKTVKENINF